MLHGIVVEPAKDEERFQRQAHLGALPKIGETLWYVARWRDEWVALIGFSSPALKCRARDARLGFSNSRLHLVTNNSRFLILPGWHRPNLASRLLSLCEQRLALAEAFRPPVVASGNLCRPLPRHDLSCGELAMSRPHAGLSPLPRRLQAEHPQTRLRSPPGSERPNAVERHRPRLPSRRAQDQRRNDECFVLRRYSPVGVRGSAILLPLYWRLRPVPRCAACAASWPWGNGRRILVRRDANGSAAGIVESATTYPA